MRAVDVIAAKRDGAEIGDEELRELVLAYAREEVADYQMSAFLMAGPSTASPPPRPRR